MRITQIDLWHVAIPTRVPFRPAWIPGLLQTANRFTLVRLRTASGLEGWSAGVAIARERQGLGSLLGPYLLGERADDIPSIRQRLREMSYLGIRAGWIEPACWDIVGKARREPVWALLGGRGGEVRVYASTGEIRTGAERVKEVEARLADGFEAVKLRVHAATLEEDLAQIRETRRGVGDRAVLAADANQGWRVAAVADSPRWDEPRAMAFCREAEALGLAWVEEPLPFDDYGALARLRGAVGVDVAGGELNGQGLPEFGVMIEKGCYDIYQPDATFVGGIAEVWSIVQRVRAAGARYTPHTWSNGIGFAVNLHLHAASPWRDETWLEYPLDPPGWVPAVRDGLLEAPWEARGGTLAVPEAPGLGFTVSRRALRRHGRLFFRATPVRVAVTAALERGLSAARAAGAARGARLAARHREVEEGIAAGRPAWGEALE